MKTTVQARLDDESQAALRQLVRRLGWSPSRVVREGLRLMVRHYGTTPKKKKIIGMGGFVGGPPDLAISKKYMEDFGR
jgi:hypothetical protein